MTVAIKLHILPFFDFRLSIAAVDTAESNTLQLVIARYKEDVSWVAETGIPATVYNKGDAMDPCPAACIPLPNIGRESHTYLHHIVRHYPHFPGHTAFLQGSPFMHLPQGMGAQALAQELRRLAAKGVPFKGLAYYTLKCDHLGRPHDLKSPQNEGKWAGWGRDIPVGEVYGKLFSGTVPERYHAKGVAGCFIVSRQRLLSRPKALYERALQIILDDPNDAYNTGHAFERLWSVIFNGYSALHENCY